MILPPIVFKDDAGATVISLSLVRESRRTGYTLPGDPCQHIHVTVDTSLAELRCDDCKERLSPVQWLADSIDNWRHIQRERDALTRERARYEAKQRTRCEHCNKITRVVPATSAEVREFDRTPKP
jgi:hypothetical protein